MVATVFSNHLDVGFDGLGPKEIGTPATSTFVLTVLAGV